jgi:hypothetical protein
MGWWVFNLLMMYLKKKKKTDTWQAEDIALDAT